MNSLFRVDRIRRIIYDLQSCIYGEATPVNLKWLAGYYASPAEAMQDLSNAVPFPDNQVWGGRNSYAWFHGEFRVPAAIRQKQISLLVATVRNESAETARLSGYVNAPSARWDLMNPQFMLFVNGTLVQGMDVHHQSAVLRTDADGHAVIDLQGFAGLTDRYCTVSVQYAVTHENVRSLYYDLLTALEAAETLDDHNPARSEILAALNEACSLLDLRFPYSPGFEAGITAAREHLSQTVYTGAREDITAVCVGHTHSDVAWLWDHTQTRIKAQRTFSGMLRLMEQYPEFTFFQSTPQLLKWVNQDNPDLYAAIKQRAAEGRIELGGSMWLEADCNIPSGESLIRQILYGKRYLRKEFNTECEVLWLPDVFGYSAALPQILQQFGIHTFVTTKISWNMLNKMPYDTFRWQGIDGSQVLTYFITTTDPKQEDSSFGTTYNGILHPASIMGGWKRYQQKELNHRILVAYGYGDGGGGPDVDMLEKGIRLQRGVKGFPKVELGHVRPFFRELHKKTKDAKYLPTWVGELYLELHQGAYTSAANMKRNNRSAEYALFAAEFLQTAAAIKGRHPYAANSLHKAWEMLLLNQFHDTLPGSCIAKVYTDAHAQFSELFRITEACRQEAASSLWGSGSTLTIWNPCSFSRSDLLLLPKGYAIAGQPYQNTAEGTLCLSPVIPPLGWTSAETVRIGTVMTETAAVQGTQTLCTHFYILEIDGNGELVRIYDKDRHRELLAPGTHANILRAFEDRPASWDTWNIDMYYEEKQYPVNNSVTVTAVSSGSVFEEVVVEKSFGRSKFTQKIRAYHDVPRVDFITHVSWHEDATVLKAEFPLALNTDFATYDIQCGSVRRPTHRNTSWDSARYEVCAHRWADLSESDYGVSLLNDSKYGHDAQGSILRITLLKAGMSPDETIDRGEHDFTYSLFPHAEACGTLTNEMAARLNQPLQTAWTAAPQPEGSLLQLDSRHIVVDAVKFTEEQDGWIVIRMHEQDNTHTVTTLAAGFDLAAAIACDLQEENRQPLPVANNIVGLGFCPFEIKTILLKPAIMVSSEDMG